MTSKLDGKIQYEFVTTMWKFEGHGGWYFVSLPLEMAKEIRDNLKSEEEGWGRLKVIAKVGLSVWETAIWFDIKRNTYLLPIKAEIRKKEKLDTDENTKAIIWI